MPKVTFYRVAKVKVASVPSTAIENVIAEAAAAYMASKPGRTANIRDNGVDFFWSNGSPAGGLYITADDVVTAEESGDDPIAAEHLGAVKKAAPSAFKDDVIDKANAALSGAAVTTKAKLGKLFKAQMEGLMNDVGMPKAKLN